MDRICTPAYKDRAQFFNYVRKKMPEGYQIRAKNTTSGKRFDFGHPYPTLNEAITGLSEWKNVSQVDINSNTFTEGTYTFTWDEIKIYYRNPDNTVDETTVYYTDN